MAEGLTLDWRGNRYDVAKSEGREAKPDKGSVWQVSRDGAPVTSFPAESGDDVEAVREKVLAWLEANAQRPAADVGRQ
ncbi:MAG TPA: hypothetical protein VEB59_02365 [Gemmatimonadales bacterium]|nr:hypothetical protein [Gemmatimonadales bacterium]